MSCVAEVIFVPVSVGLVVVLVPTSPIPSGLEYLETAIPATRTAAAAAPPITKFLLVLLTFSLESALPSDF